ncbi:hypothetical protein Hanom_Chr07g00598421 [Helianthus anomalus]
MEPRSSVPFPPFNLFHLLLISTLFITKSTSIPHQISQLSYSKYCNDVVEEHQISQFSPAR